jgi:hypothetical protein
MSTALRPQSTTKALSSVAILTRSPYVALVLESVRQCRHTAGGWRRKDLLRGRVSWLNQFFLTLQELRDQGATPADIEGVLAALSNAGRALATQGLTPVNESLAEALHRESELEGAENISTVEVLTHPTAGNLRKLRAATLAEIDASYHVVGAIDAELLKIEGR